MTTARSAKLLWDAEQAAARVLRFTTGHDKASYLVDELLRSAVERQFEIVGEALAGLRRADPDLAARIPELPRVVAFRNILIHGYATVDSELVWAMVVDHLPPLHSALAKLLASIR